MNNKKFKMLDEEFICSNCRVLVKPLEYSARDHCPVCLYGKHVDNNPGDRLNNCHGPLIPKSIEKHNNTYKIIYKCAKCQIEKKNVMANDDNMDLIIKLSVNDS